jgi:benzodiazapine receptor
MLRSIEMFRVLVLSATLTKVKPNGMRPIYKLLISLALAFAAAGIGSFFTISAIPTWYAELAKPSFNPPAWVFGPAWSLLYTLMGVALFRVWNSKHSAPTRGSAKPARTLAFVLFVVQLVLNALWTIVFFGLHQLGPALIVIAALWLAILACIVTFWRLERTAALLLLPYLAWVTFASLLNFAVWRLN